MLMRYSSNFRRSAIRSAVLNENILARSSSSARVKLYQELKGRYILDEETPLFSAFLEEWHSFPDERDRLFLSYILFALNDLTVMVTSIGWLFPFLRQAPSELKTGDLVAYFEHLAQTSYPEIKAWSPSTLCRMARHYLASVRDFGLASGGTRKVTVRPALQPAALRLLLKALLMVKVPSDEIIRHQAFKILGIAPSEIVETLAELNRQRVLRFRMQADVIELFL
ncbi:hypothetical protein OPIT5_23285 [Opitutaceae bacterium TAV5]|nr:hypothetical protein OPIT5_23285 [Opitutaceae bacterium TAV5]